MINVCNLEPEYFKEILTGSKRTEYRRRQRRSKQLESIKTGEQLYILEIGSDRFIRVKIRSVSWVFVTERDDSYLEYSITFGGVVGYGTNPIRKIQGWHRRETLDLPPLKR